MSRKVLVTGSTGFVGRHLIPKMMDSGYQVRVATRTSSSPFQGVEVVQVGNYLDNPDWDRAVAGVNAVVHLAARVHVMRDTASNPLREFQRMNVSVTRDLAEASVRERINRLVFLSSIKVNGESTESGRPFTVSDIPNPQDPYAVSKFQAEQVLWGLSQSAGLPVSVIRPPLVYGPGVSGNFLRLLQLTNAGFPLPLASAQRRRSILFVSNLVHRILTALAIERGTSEIAIAADSNPVSTSELIRMIARESGKPSRLFKVPAGLLKRGAHVVRLHKEFERIFGGLEVVSGSTEPTHDWLPPYTTEAGIAETWQWYDRAIRDRS